jgi:hypothetical protein
MSALYTTVAFGRLSGGVDYSLTRPIPLFSLCLTKSVSKSNGTNPKTQSKPEDPSHKDIHVRSHISSPERRGRSKLRLDLIYETVH